MAPILLIFLKINCYASVLFSAKTKTPDRRHNLSRPYIKLKVYGQTVLLDGGTMAGMGDMAGLPPPPGSAMHYLMSSIHCLLGFSDTVALQRSLRLLH